MKYVRDFFKDLPDMEIRDGTAFWVVNGGKVDMKALVESGHFTAETDDKCWCHGRVGTRETGEMGCLDSIYHDWDSTGDPESVRTLYVAGPMTGYEYNNYPAFDGVAGRLRDAGYRVVNPAEFGSDKGHYVDLLRQDLVGLLGCDGIAFHGDWWNSTGARNEINVGGLLRMPVRSVEDWVERASEELSQHKKENAHGK